MKRLKQTKWAQFVVLHRRLLLVLGSVILLSIALAVAGFLKKADDNSADKIIFVIEGEQYRESTVNHLIDFSILRGLSREEAAKEAFKLAKRKKTAEKLDIKPTDQEVEIQRQKLIENLKNEEEFSERYSSWFDLLAYTNAVDRYINTTPNDGYRGYVFEIPFGQHVQYGPAFTPDGLNDPKLVAEDKKYAEERANHYYEQLKNNVISPDQAVQELNNDRRLSVFEAGNATKSVKFGYDPEVNWQEEIYYSSVSEFILQSENTGLSELKIGKASVDSTPENQADMYFYFVLLEKSPETKSISKQSFEETLTNLKTEFRGF